MKKWIIVAVALAIIGAVLCVAAAASMEFDFHNLDTGKYETSTYEVKDSFHSISVSASVERIVLRPSEGAGCKVVCYEEEHMEHEVSVTGGTLTIKAVDRRQPTDHVLFNFKEPVITLYLPERVYAALRIDTHTGDVELPADFLFDSITVNGNTSDVTCLASAKGGIDIALTTGDITMASVKAGKMDLKVTTGRIDAASVKCDGDVSIHANSGKTKLRDLTCGTLTSEGTTGDITLDHVDAAEAISITRGTGDVEFNASDAASIYVKTDTGDVTGSLRSEKVFITETHTGKVRVPTGIRGGRCEISTHTGDIIIEVR